jgi:hypothetical protein
VIDRQSQTWLDVERECQDGIDAARGRIDMHGLPIESTEYQRGMLAALRMVLALGVAPKPARAPLPTHDSAGY